MPYKNREDKRKYDRERYRKNPKFREQVKKYYEEHREQCLQYLRRYYTKHRDDILKHRTEYREMKREEINKKQREYGNSHRKQKRVELAAWRKVTIGNSCEICGSTENLERHHPDYDRPLEVQTLCRRCHRRIHRGEQNQSSSDTTS